MGLFWVDSVKPWNWRCSHPLRFVPFDEPHGPNFDGLSFLEESVVQTRVFTPLPGDRNPPILLPSVWALIGWSVLQK